jgi:hypothetical protein
MNATQSHPKTLSIVNTGRNESSLVTPEMQTGKIALGISKKDLANEESTLESNPQMILKSNYKEH